MITGNKWYRVGVIFNPNDVVRWLKGKNEGTWSTTRYRYGCRLFSRGEACGLKDLLNSRFNTVKGGGYALMESA